MSAKSGAIRQAIGLVKKRVQATVKACNTIMKTNVPKNDADAAEQFVDDIELAMSKLKTAVNSLSDRDKQWTDLITELADEDITIEEGLYEQTASSAIGYLAILEEGKELLDLLECKKRKAERSVKQSQTTVCPNTATSSTNDGNKVSRSAKLPKLELPVFKGDPIDWQPFWSVFESNIDKAELTGVEKFSYLRNNCLQGNAKDTIGGLPITDEAYIVAIDLLKERYQRTPEEMVGHLYSQLKRLPVASMKTKDLQSTYDSCEKIIRQLKNANESVESNRSLVLDICSKYPDQVLTELTHRKAISNRSTLAEVQAALKDYIVQSDTLSEMLHDLQPFNRQAPKSNTNRPQQFNQMPNSTGGSTPGHSYSKSWSKPGFSTALMAADQTMDRDSTTPMSPCYFCEGNHFNSKCVNYQTVDQRLERLGQVQRCQRCLDLSHTTEQCRTYPSRIKCFFCKSSGDHVSALCPAQFGQQSSIRLAANVQAKTNSKVTKSIVKQKSVSEEKTDDTPCVLGVEEQAMLATAETVIRNPVTGVERTVRVILDNGCPRTFILESVAKDLGLMPIAKKQLYIAAFGCKRTASHPSVQLQFQMQLRDGKTLDVEANSVNLIVNQSAQPGDLPEATQRLVDSMGYAMADNPQNEGPPEVLIGSDYFWQLIPCNRLTSDDGVLLISSSLGLLLGGRCKTDNPEEPSLLCLTERSSATAIDTHLSAISTMSKAEAKTPDVDEFWNLERIGINDDPIEDDDEVAQREFDSTVRFDDGRYQVCWPWKETKHQLPTNYGLALGRFRSLSKRLTDTDGTLLQEYNKIIQDQLHRGIIEEVPAGEVVSPNYTVHYLPHHPVVRAGHNTTKVRVVYDASSKCRKDQMSLNECLYRGPVLLPDLCSILLRFRLHTVAIISDIEKAFLQLGLQPSERDVTRFLWFKNPNLTVVDGNIVVYRFKRVPFGVISSPFLLGATILFHLERADTEIANDISKDTYVDNVISGTDSEESALQFYDAAKQLFSDANMNIREWCSNSSALLQHIPDVDICSNRTVKVLGLKWDSEADSIQLNTSSVSLYCDSKRGVLKAIASIYDPLGLFQPCTLKAKCFMRQLWDDELGWDDKLSSKMTQDWEVLVKDLAPIFEVKMPRLIENKSQEINLAVFSDASKDAYAAAVYLRIRDPHSDAWNATLVYSKSRLSPRLKTPVSLPRLELLGLTIAVRAADFVRKSLRCKDDIPCFLFCDSVCVLSWVKTEKPLKRFVANRVKQIRCFENAEYHYVQSKDNPADVCTRGLTGTEIASSNFWWHGPVWLKANKEHWLIDPPIEPFSDQDFLKEISVVEEAVLLAAEGQPEDAETSPFGIQFERFSSFYRLNRVIAYCLKFLAKVTSPLFRTDPEAKPVLRRLIKGVTTDHGITAKELDHAKSTVLKSVQSQSFQDVFEAIESNKHHQLLSQLNLTVGDDRLLRCLGRLTQADIEWETVSPILLPKNHYVTNLIITESHKKLFHFGGVSHTLSEMRRQYWVPQGRNAVRRVLNRCCLCRKHRGPPFALPKMPPLPRERVARSKPFQFVGLDYLGPVNVKISDESTQKMWCCLFTCLTVRAVHLECVTDCTAECFMECLSRFIARRGCPEQVISDNAPQFRLAKTIIDKTWQRVMTDDGVKGYIAERGINWKFITQLAPWQGGFYERLVGVVKSTFKSIIGRRLLKWDQFITLITETEAIVNTRPITYVHSDIDSGMALRPMDFIVPTPTGTPIVDPTLRPEGGDAGKLLLAFWKSKQKRLDALWVQWYDNYLLSLRERDQSTHKGPRSKVNAPPKIGEVVIVKSTDAPRGHWKLARIVSHVPSKDGSVRSVELVLPNRVIIKRAVNHLYGIEIPSVDVMAGDATAAVETANDDAPEVIVGNDEDFDGFTPDEVEATELQHQYRFGGVGNASEDAQINLATLVAAATNNIEGSLAVVAVATAF